MPFHDIDIVPTSQSVLIVDLANPDLMAYNLYKGAEGSANNIVQSHLVDVGSKGYSVTWNLHFVDRAGQDLVYINSWTLILQ